MTARRRRRAPRLVITTRIFAPEPVPASFRLAALAEEFAEAGWDVTVLTTRPPSGATVRPAAGYRVGRFPVLRDAAGQIRGYLQYLSYDLPLALRLLLRRRPDLVVAEPPPTTLTVVRAASLLRRVPYACYAGDVWSDASEQTDAPSWIVRIVRAAEVGAWKQARFVFSISDGVADRVRELTGNRPGQLMIGNGVDTTVFTPDGPRRDLADEISGIEPGTPFLVYAGTVSEWQGADIFVDALAELAARGAEVPHLIFLADGSQVAALQARGDRQVPGHVHVLGRRPVDEAAAWQRSAVACLSSIVPGLGYDFALPTKMYSSAASGTPVLHAGRGAAHDRVAGAPLGWAADFTPQDVADAMTSALAAARGEEPGPDREHLVTWVADHASLRSCARTARRAVEDELAL
jgi:glycosyltransferase involved in cell wall biosynthesis